MKWLLKFVSMPMFESDSGGASGGSSGSEPSVEQLRQQLSESQAKLNQLNSQIEAGKLVDPAAYISAEVKAGNLFPKDRFVGLQQTYQTEQETHKETRKALTAATSTERELKNKLTEYETNLNTLNTQLQERQAQLSEFEKKIARKDTIMDKFPHLAPFEAKGLLPPGEGEELEKLLDLFSVQLETSGADKAKDLLTGGGTRMPSGKKESEAPAPKTAEEFRLAALAALKSPDAAERAKYDVYMDTYYGKLAEEALK